MNSKLNIHLKSRCRNSISASAFFLLFLFTYSAQAKLTSTSFNDSLKKKYPLTDPRNPNCPCHKFQKKAEKEYRNLTKKANIKTGLNHETITNERIYNRKSLYTTFTFLRVKKKSKIKGTTVRSRHKVFSFNIKSRFKVTDCPKW